MEQTCNWLKAISIIIIGLLLAASVLLSPFGILLIAASLISIPVPSIRLYIFRVWESFDQTINTIGFGNVDHTISGRVGRMAEEGEPLGLILEKIINKVLWFDANHCRRSIERDEKKVRYSWS